MRNTIFKFFLLILIVNFSVNSCKDSATPSNKFAQTPINQQTVETNTDNNLIVISTDLNIGENRFVFAIIDNDQNPISIPNIKINLTNSNQTTTAYNARFEEWPSGKTGVYVSHPYFDIFGTWNIKTTISPNNITLNTNFIVATESKTPTIGEPAPKSTNKTRFSHPNLSEITSDIEPNLDLYTFTIKESVENSNPILLTFSTPGFCQTATCGPQVKIISDLSAKYKNTVNFIHVEIYDNPHELALHFAKRRIAPTVSEWGIFTEPFTFLVDKNGIVSAKYEGFATYSEIESDLTKLIESDW